MGQTLRMRNEFPKKNGQRLPTWCDFTKILIKTKNHGQKCDFIKHFTTKTISIAIRAFV